MSLNYSPEEIRPLYEKLPQDLKEALFSKDSADAISNICLENNIPEKNTELAKYVGYIMLGLLPPDQFAKTLQEELELEKDAAEKVYRQVARIIFPPIKESLETLYNAKIEIPTKLIEVVEEASPLSKRQTSPTIKTKPPPPLKTKKPKTEDKYREVVE